MMDIYVEMYDIRFAPKDCYIILFGCSGYITTPHRAEIGTWSKEKQCWVTHSGDRFTDGGGEPIGWWPLPDPSTT